MVLFSRSTIAGAVTALGVFASLTTAVATNEVGAPTVAYTVDGEQLKFIESTTEDGATQSVFESDDRRARLLLDTTPCTRGDCTTLMNETASVMAEPIEGSESTFRSINQTEFWFQLESFGLRQEVFVFQLPNSIVMYNYILEDQNQDVLSGRFEDLLETMEGIRYREIITADNVTRGLWAHSALNHARNLLSANEEEEALKALRLATKAAPYLYEAHILLAETSENQSERREAATIVERNAVDPKLLEAAARVLGKAVPNIEDFPQVGPSDDGLQLILIPIPPVNVWLLEEAAEKFRLITGLDVNIRQLPGELNWNPYDRSSYQRNAREFLARITGTTNSTWSSEEDLIDQIKLVRADLDPISAFHADRLVDELSFGQRQYQGGYYLSLFISRMIQVRSHDLRTLYVGITESDIYDGNSNFVFSLSRPRQDDHGAILSYRRMMADMAGDRFVSRSKLTDRIAKEMVPAALQPLRIPRSADPSCPYSYSDGIGRVDEKTFRLAPTVQEMLNAYRD